MRWRTAHVFRDVEQKVSKYLLTITMVNIGVGVVVAGLMWAIGMPSPILWGALAAVLNYIPYVGQAFMALVLFVVGLATKGDLAGATRAYESAMALAPMDRDVLQHSAAFFLRLGRSVEGVLYVIKAGTTVRKAAEYGVKVQREARDNVNDGPRSTRRTGCASTPRRAHPRDIRPPGRAP